MKRRNKTKVYLILFGTILTLFFCSGAYRKTDRAAKLPLPIGISDYRLASSEYYYIDKTEMIRDFIDERPMVSLFTRPRRFGKTLNMDMLRTFFEKSGEDTSVYFKDKKIWSCGKKYRDHQGKYPVIFVTFKDIKYSTWEKTFAALKDVFAKSLLFTTKRSCSSCDRSFRSPRRSPFRKRFFQGIIIEIIELKAEKGCSEAELRKLSETALRQIIDKSYDAQMKSEGVEVIYRYGVAFSGKRVEVAAG